ncbi:hypothetical protein [Mucilaginibacter arboris]|uniref:YARHG domain-containing protein n=1 Tax=Mucilaginibacter arboris TaxID=2682090 RepID=A0A7K1STR1_9SPHI|nr:hypothetical protein [Mucilaginibacter arboris]MVN20701.1 hypothetical protein [Mucilaginibacter arboris]
MKIIFLLFSLSFTSISVLLAQDTSTDYTKAKLVKNDIRHFYLNKQDWKACRKQNFKPTSDYFKPNEGNVSNPALLSDSDYVQAYRSAALKKPNRNVPFCELN